MRYIKGCRHGDGLQIRIDYRERRHMGHRYGAWLTVTCVENHGVLITTAPNPYRSRDHRQTHTPRPDPGTDNATPV